MTPICHDVACAVCGIVACAHFAAVIDVAYHSHSYETQPVVLSESLPPHPDHTHDDFERTAHIESKNVTVSGTSSAAPFVPIMDSSDLLYRARRQRQHPAYLGWSFSAALSAPQVLSTG